MKFDFIKEAEVAHEELISLIESLCVIPAPLHEEGKRAAFILNWLEKNNLPGAFVDRCGNVILPYECNAGKYIAFTAHMDTVFKETVIPPVEHEGTIAKCPGVGDDTTHLATQLLLARWIIHHQMKLSHPVLFVWDTGEEGLGDLKGARGLMQEYEGKIGTLVALDAVYSTMIDRAVGSVRYQITIETEGGHSFRNFGHANAIERASQLIGLLYQQELPAGQTTYNVGSISGGTSINTIAQEAQLLYEFRSDEAASLDFMEKQLFGILEQLRPKCRDLHVEEIGRRPASGPRGEGQEALEQLWIDAAKDALPEMTMKVISGSTDCNIPLSEGIPAICVGVYRGGAAHTHEEWIDYESLKKGYEILLRFVGSLEE